MPDVDGLTSDEKAGEGEGDEMEEEEVEDEEVGGGQIQMIPGGTGPVKDAPY